MKALLRTGEDEGVIFLPGTRLVGADRHPQGIALRTERETILAGQVVNAAGLYADEVSRMLGGETFTIYPCRGEYAELTPAKRALVNALVYPLPHLGPRPRRAPGADDRRAVWLGPTIRYQERKDDYESDRLPLEASPSRRGGCSRRHARRPAAVGQRHPREAAPAERVVRRFHDPPRSRESRRSSRRPASIRRG